MLSSVSTTAWSSVSASWPEVLAPQNIAGLFSWYNFYMDLHPIFVHFPIAFLTVYAIFELVRFRRIVEKPYWHEVKAVLVIVGFAGAVIAAITGGVASNWAIGGPRIFAMHQIFALITIVLSGIAAFGYIKNNFSSLVYIVLAALILVSITITGGLGGAMVRGTDFDPLMAPIFKLLGVY